MPDTSLLESLTGAITDVIGRALDGVDDGLPPLDPPDEGGARGALSDLADRGKAVTDAGDLGGWVSAVRDWHSALEDVADKALGGPTPVESLLVRVLQDRMPRTAAFLTLAGVIVPVPDGRDRIDRDRAQQLFTDPGTLVNEDLWDALLGDASIPGTGRLPAVIVAALLLAPQTIIALVRGDVTVAGLPAPPTDGPGPWRTFRENTADWVSFTVPFGDPAAQEPMPSGIYDWQSGLAPDLSATLALRSRRVKDGGDSRTEFEMWLALALEEDRWRYFFGEPEGDDTRWRIQVDPGISAGFGYDGEWHGAFRQMLTDPELVPGPKDPVSITFGRDMPEGTPDILLGPPYDTRLIGKDLELYIRVREDHPIVEIGASLQGFSLILTNRWWRTFGQTSNLREGVRVDLDLDIAYVEGTGLRLNLGAGLEFLWAIGWKILDKKSVGLTLHSVRVKGIFLTGGGDWDLRVEVTFHISVRIGPVVLVVDGLGGWVGRQKIDGEDVYVGFLPPTGAGVQITAGPVTGGGFLEWGRQPNVDDRFAGVLYLKIFSFEVTAFGIHELTGARDDPARKTSFVMVIGVRFAPGIQVGFGFAITGFGGLVGINRRADTDALRERLTSGAAGNVLFAEDPIRNAPAILGDLAALFPAAEGVHVFGPTVQLTWLKIAGSSMFKADVGIFFELTGSALTKILLLGSVRATVPDVGEDVPKLLQLRFDVVGVIDFPKKVVEVDATLIRSRALYSFHLTGDLAFRFSWGERPYFLLSFGGFHPRFDPKPGQFPELTRLALTLVTKFKGLHFRAEAYLAVTSNTIQFGGKIEIGYKFGPINVTGFLALDAIIQFSPFWFEIAISAGVRLRWNEMTICGARLEGRLSGPGPFLITGKVCIELLFFDICGSATIPLGSSAGQPAPPSTASTAQALKPEIVDPENLSSEGADDRHAVLRPRPGAPGAPPVLAPLGRVRWAQKRAPLGTTLDRFEGQPLAAQQRVVASCALSTGSAVDWFAPGGFANLTESEALSRPGFERLDAGVVLGAGMQQSASVPHTVTVIEVRLPRFDFAFDRDMIAFAAVTLAGVRARTGPAAVRSTEAKVTVADDRFSVFSHGGASIQEGLTITEAHQRARMQGGIAVHPADVVALEGL